MLPAFPVFFPCTACSIGLQLDVCGGASSRELGPQGGRTTGAERTDQDLQEVVAPDLVAHLMVENSLEFSREPGVTTHPHGGTGLSTRAAGASDLWGPIF